MNNQPSMTVFEKDSWKRRNTRVPPNFADGGCRKFCSVEITAQSRNGGKNNRKNGHAKIDRTCCASKNQSRSFPKITQALIPPNPNELLITYFNFVARP